jgi:hypothetical protein
MPGIAMSLMGFGAESSHQKCDVAYHDVEKLGGAAIVMMGEGCFQ